MCAFLGWCALFSLCCPDSFFFFGCFPFPIFFRFTPPQLLASFGPPSFLNCALNLPYRKTMSRFSFQPVFLSSPNGTPRALLTQGRNVRETFAIYFMHSASPLPNELFDVPFFPLLEPFPYRFFTSLFRPCVFFFNFPLRVVLSFPFPPANAVPSFFSLLPTFLLFSLITFLVS